MDHSAFQVGTQGVIYSCFGFLKELPSDFVAQNSPPVTTLAQTRAGMQPEVTISTCHPLKDVLVVLRHLDTWVWEFHSHLLWNLALYSLSWLEDAQRLRELHPADPHHQRVDEMSEQQSYSQLLQQAPKCHQTSPNLQPRPKLHHLWAAMEVNRVISAAGLTHSVFTCQ